MHGLDERSRSIPYDLLSAVVLCTHWLTLFPLAPDDQYAHMLTPAFALSGSIPVNPPTYENMSASELDAFLAEMEPDIRAAERDLREICALEDKGVTGAGKLGDYEVLQPRLESLLRAHDEDLKMAAELEKRIALLMDHYATNVSPQLSGARKPLNLILG